MKNIKLNKIRQKIKNIKNLSIIPSKKDNVNKHSDMYSMPGHVVHGNTGNGGDGTLIDLYGGQLVISKKFDYANSEEESKFPIITLKFGGRQDYIFCPYSAEAMTDIEKITLDYLKSIKDLESKYDK